MAVFGNAAAALEKRDWADSVARGGAHVAACLVPLALLGAGVEKVTAKHPMLRVITTAATTWAVIGATSLADEGQRMYVRLDEDDLAGAREQLSHLCSRDADPVSYTHLTLPTID